MKKLFMLLEEVWVTGAFAEAGVYETDLVLKDRLICQYSNHQHAAYIAWTMRRP